MTQFGISRKHPVIQNDQYGKTLISFNLLKKPHLNITYLL